MIIRPVHVSQIVSLLIASLLTHSPYALEGGLTTTSTNWTRHPVPSMTRPSKEERQQELAQRAKDMAAQKAALEARLKQVPDEATMAKVKRKLQEIYDNNGWVPELNVVYGLRDMQPMMKGQGTLNPGLLAGYKQFQKDLKERDIDLIVLPYPAMPHFTTHLLVDGVDPQDEIYPGYTEMLLTFLENDIEVVDFISEFRLASGGDIDVHWPNDTHVGSLGRQISARKLAERLQRYDFARDRANGNDPIGYTEVKWTGAKTGWSQYLLNARIQGNNKKDPLKSTNIPDVMPTLASRPMTRVQVTYPDGKNKKNPHGRSNPSRYGFQDLVLVGDSQLHTAVWGSGMPEFVYAELDGICRWGSKSWSGFSLPEIYLETVPNKAEAQPRVVVVFHLFFKLPAKEDSLAKYKPKSLPPMKGEIAEGAPGTLPFNARVRIVRFSKPKDPNSVDYTEALMQAEGLIVEGPLAGTTVGLRHEVMHKSRLAKKFEKGGHPRILGKEVNLRLVPWQLATKQDPELGTIMVYDDTDLDLAAPIFWVTEGPLNRRAMRSR